MSYGGYTGPINPNPDLASFNNYINLYNYTPDLGFNVFAAIVWAATTGAHCYWFVKHRETRVVQGLIAFGAVWEFICCVVRSLNHTLIFRSDLFFTQYAINQVVPIIFYGAIHNAIENALPKGQKIDRYLPITPKALSYCFGVYDAACALVTILGASFLGHGWARIAQNLPQGVIDFVQAGYSALETGLANQIANLFITLGVLTWLGVRSVQDREHAIPLRTIAILFLTNGILFTRAAYRMGETAEGVFGMAWNSEALFGVFEFATTWVAVTIWAIFPIGQHYEQLVEVLHDRKKRWAPYATSV